MGTYSLSSEEGAGFNLKQPLYVYDRDLSERISGEETPTLSQDVTYFLPFLTVNIVIREFLMGSSQDNPQKFSAMTLKMTYISNKSHVVTFQEFFRKNLYKSF